MKYDVTVTKRSEIEYEVEAETEENARNHYANGRVVYSREETTLVVHADTAEGIKF